MEKLMKWVEEKLVPPMVKIGTQRYLSATRNGVVSTLSLILTGTFFMVFINLLFPGWNEFIALYSAAIVLPFRMAMGPAAIYVTSVMGPDLAKSYGSDSVTGGILPLGTFLMLQVPVNVLTPGEAPLGWVLSMSSLGASGIFVGVLSVIFVVEVCHSFKNRDIIIKMPEQVPPVVARSFEALTPGAVILAITWLIRSVAGFDADAALLSLFEPLTNIPRSNLLGVLLPTSLIHLLWSFGIHGMSIVEAVVRSIRLIMLDENAKALADGTAATQLPYIAPEQFYRQTVAIDGVGATIVVSVLFIFFCKSKFLKEVGRFSIIPGIFNINEPIIFGAPTMSNPYMFIPFNLVPLALTIISYFVVKLEMVNRFTVLPTWTSPAPIGGYLPARNDWHVVILIVTNTLIALIIYYPFVKVYDKKMLSDEQSRGENEAQTV